MQGDGRGEIDVDFSLFLVILITCLFLLLTRARCFSIADASLFFVLLL
jgi:hypothetical protein